MIPEDVDAELRAALRSVKKNAAIRQRTVEITICDVRNMWLEAGGLCSVSGLPFDLRKCINSQRRPFAISIDRINSREPYTQENCRLVCIAVNYAMSDWGQEVLERIAYAIVRRKKGVARVGMRGKSESHGLRGVSRRILPGGGLAYQVSVTVAGKRRYAGTFHTPEAAHEHWKTLQAQLQQNPQSRWLSRLREPTRGAVTS